jgi:hypothetical protein
MQGEAWMSTLSRVVLKTLRWQQACMVQMVAVNCDIVSRSWPSVILTVACGTLVVN